MITLARPISSLQRHPQERRSERFTKWRGGFVFREFPINLKLQLTASSTPSGRRTPRIMFSTVSGSIYTRCDGATLAGLRTWKKCCPEAGSLGFESQYSEGVEFMTADRLIPRSQTPLQATR